MGYRQRLYRWHLRISTRGVDHCVNVGYILGNEYIGGICGELFDDSLDTCRNSGTVTGFGGYTGGICGNATYEYEEGCQIASCINDGSVLGGGSLGGICGSTSGVGVVNCTNFADVTWLDALDKTGYVGGIVGNGYPYNCINYGSITMNNDGLSSTMYVGGICGSSYTVKNCLNAGTVSATKTSTARLGGVCGDVAYGTMENCYSTSAPLFGYGRSATLENNSLCTLSDGEYTLALTVSAGDYAGKDLLQAMNAYVLQDYMLGDVYDEYGWPVRLMRRYCFWENQNGILTATAGAAVKHDNSAQLLGTFDKRAAADDQLLLTAAAYRDGKMIAADCKEMQKIEGYLLWMDLDTTSADELKLLITDRNWKPWSSTPSQP